MCIYFKGYVTSWNRWVVFFVSSKCYSVLFSGIVVFRHNSREEYEGSGLVFYEFVLKITLNYLFLWLVVLSVTLHLHLGGYLRWLSCGRAPGGQQRVQQDACGYRNVERLDARHQLPARWDGEKCLTRGEQLLGESFSFSSHQQQRGFGHFKVWTLGDGHLRHFCFLSHCANHLPALLHLQLQHLCKVFISIHPHHLHNARARLADHWRQRAGIAKTAGDSVHPEEISRAQDGAEVHGVVDSLQNEPQWSIFPAGCRVLGEVAQGTGKQAHSLMDSPIGHLVQLLPADPMDSNSSQMSLLAHLQHRRPVRGLAIFYKQLTDPPPSLSESQEAGSNAKNNLAVLRFGFRCRFLLHLPLPLCREIFQAQFPEFRWHSEVISPHLLLQQWDLTFKHFSLSWPLMLLPFCRLVLDPGAPPRYRADLAVLWVQVWSCYVVKGNLGGW